MSSQLTLGSLPQTACCFLVASCALTEPLNKTLAISSLPWFLIQDMEELEHPVRADTFAYLQPKSP